MFVLFGKPTLGVSLETQTYTHTAMHLCPLAVARAATPAVPAPFWSLAAAMARFAPPRLGAIDVVIA